MRVEIPFVGYGWGMNGMKGLASDGLGSYYFAVWFSQSIRLNYTEGTAISSNTVDGFHVLSSCGKQKYFCTYLLKPLVGFSFDVVLVGQKLFQFRDYYMFGRIKIYD